MSTTNRAYLTKSLLHDFKRLGGNLELLATQYEVLLSEILEVKEENKKLKTIVTKQRLKL